MLQYIDRRQDERERLRFASRAAVAYTDVPMKILHLDMRPDWRGEQPQIPLILRGLRARGDRWQCCVAPGVQS